MGCGESKIKKINLTPDVSYSMTPSLDTVSGSLKVEYGSHPNRLLSSAIPISDLGESLDSRQLKLDSSLNLSHKKPSSASPTPRPPESSRIYEDDGFTAPYSGDSLDSGDSGYDEYEEDYSHIITEHSPRELVNSVIKEFKPVDLPELLVITGRACARKLSGYQKAKIQEAKILDTLREEGLLAKTKAKTAGGFSFEVVDQNLKEEETFISSQFMPSKTLKKLESRRETVRKPSTDIEDRLAIAETRRKAAEEEKIEKCREISGIERHERMRTASALKREQRYSATVAKRQMHLKEMRDKLKHKHRKHDLIRMKHQILNGSPSSSFNFEYEGSFEKDFFKD